MVDELNLKFKEVIIEKSECLGGSYQFDSYKNKNGDTILISPYFDIEAYEPKHHISLIDLKNNIVIQTLNGHKDRVITIRYFQDPNSKNDYLISVDRKCLIIVWDLNNYSIKVKKTIAFESFVYGVMC